MWLRLGSARATGLALGLLGLVSACRSPGSERIVGPDGSAMAHVHCGSEQGECFRIAGELCPGGYEMHAVLSGSDGNFLVRCRTAAASAVAAACAPTSSPAPGAAVAPAPASSPSGTLATKDRWPPATEPWPATYPWPPPETSAAVRAPGAAPGKPQGDIDIGY